MTDKLRGKISILSQLANIDNDFDIRELAFIYNICLRNNIEVDSIADIISNPEPSISLEKLSQEDKADYLSDLFLLMMIDGKVLPKEVQFCLEIGKRLGFDPNSINSLIQELSDVQNISEEYVRKKVDLLPKTRSNNA